MEVFMNKFMYYSEILFYIILISVIMIISAVPIITIGAAVAASCNIFLLLPEKDFSMNIKELLKGYFRCYIKIIPQTMITTGWFIMIIYSVFKMMSLIKLGTFGLALVFLVVFELFLMFQIIFILYGEKKSTKYFDTIISAFSIVHRYLYLVALMAFLQLFFGVIVFLIPWTIVIMPGLSLFINVQIYRCRIKPKIMTASM